MKVSSFFIILYLFVGQLNGQNISTDSLSNLIKTAEEDTFRINLYNELAFQYINTNPAFAKDDVNIALEKAKEIEYERGVARALNILGGINWAVSNYAEALDYYLESASKYEQLDDQLGLAKCYNNIGEIYKKLGEYENSLEYLLRAKPMLESEVGSNKALLIYNNIAEVYLIQGKLEQAEQYFDMILSRDELQTDRKLAYAYMGMGEIAFRRGNYEKAEQHYFKAMEIREQMKDNRGIAQASVKIGELLNAQGLHDSAEIYQNKAFELASKIDAKDLMIKALEGKVISDSSRQNYKDALSNYFVYSQLKDSTFNKEKSDQIARLQTAYETELLKKENEANEIKVKQQNTLVIGVIMALLLCLALAGAFYVQRKSQQEANKLLEAKNKVIEARNKEIEEQSKELQKLNETLKVLNKGLEEKVEIRTKLLREQNEVLSQYAFTNAHELRAPVANILGLVHLLEHTPLSNREEEIVDHLRKATAQLDKVIADIRYKLENKEEIIDTYRF